MFRIFRDFWHVWIWACLSLGWFNKFKTVQGYTVFKFYPLSFKYRDLAAGPLDARQCMFENHAIKLINRVLS